MDTRQEPVILADETDLAEFWNGATDSEKDELEKPATCMHSFFAIGDEQMKCTFCGVGK